MTIKAPFQPAYTTGQVVSPAAAAASVTLLKNSKSVCLTNTGSNTAYVRISPTAANATTADYPVIAGSQVVIGKADDDISLSHISASGTTLHIICGEGF